MKNVVNINVLHIVDVIVCINFYTMTCVSNDYTNTEHGLYESLK